MKASGALLLTIGLILMAAFAIAEQQQDRGPEQMILEGGAPGDVPFPHRLHQKSANDRCEVCHDLFPQKRGSIQQMIADGKLRSKEIMNKHCVKCHREMKREGKVTGPTSCTQCHSED